MTYLTHDIPVDGGLLRVGEWRPADPDAPVLFGLHGMTGSHLMWQHLAEALPDVRIIAPDLRGRGRSAELPAPFGVAQHARDAVAVCDALHLATMTVAGHCLGAFAAVSLANARPSMVSRLLLIDGGLPLAVPLHIDDSDLLEAVLGRASRRYAMTFDTLEVNRRFWQLHPSFKESWDAKVERIADYDVVEHISDEGELEYRPVAAVEALAVDARELAGSAATRQALASLTVPTTLMTAPRGLLNESPGVYSDSSMEQWRAEFDGIQFETVDDVNHYTILISERGAGAVASEYSRGARVISGSHP